MSEHPMDLARRNGAVRIPDGIIAEICEATNGGRPTGWPRYYDRTGEVWAETSERHNGDVVMLPSAGDMEPMLRRDVQAEYGPLVPEILHSEYLAAKGWRLTTG